MTDHERNAGTPSGTDDLTPLVNGRSNWFFHQYMHAAINAGKRYLTMQICRRCNGDGIDVQIEQFINIGGGHTPDSARNNIRLFAVWISNSYEVDIRQTGKDTGMITAH